MSKILVVVSFVFVSFSSCTGLADKQRLANQILPDTNLPKVDSMAHATIRNGFSAGSGYSQIWARDMNTSIEIACEENDPHELREAILLFLTLQQPNDEMIGGYVLKEDFTWYDDTPYYSNAAPEHVAFKNTVETDQESSLVRIVDKYIRKTGNWEMLNKKVVGKTILERMNAMIDYLMRGRYNEKYELPYGAMAADWGDVQPNDNFGCDVNDLSDPVIDVYDNAIFIIALDYLLEMTPDSPQASRWKSLREGIERNVRAHLWDVKRQKFVPHIYPERSPIPGGFDELAIHYHGGTTIAIEAGLLSKDEIHTIDTQMLENVRLPGMSSIGLTLYPVYPDGFLREGVSKAYLYQNGGNWTWFGGRMIQQLAVNGMAEEIYVEIHPMAGRVIQNDGFYEWYSKDSVPNGSDNFKGSTGMLSRAIESLRDRAEKNKS